MQAGELGASDIPRNPVDSIREECLWLSGGNHLQTVGETMHRSRFCSVLIDCNVDDLDEAARFWSRAFGKAVKPSDDLNYRELATGDDELIIMVQKVTHPSRVHLDIETDNLEAEVAGDGSADAEQSLRCCGSTYSLRVVDLAQNAQAALVVSASSRRDRHPSRCASKQRDA